MATSTVPMMLSTLDGLFTSAFGEVQVLYGDSGREAERQNLVLSGNVDFQDESWAELGARSRREKYGLDGFLQCRDPGDNAQQSLEAAWILAASVENVLRQLMQPGDQTLFSAIAVTFPGQTVQIEDVEFKPKNGRSYPTDEGTAYQIDFMVDVTARI